MNRIMKSVRPVVLSGMIVAVILCLWLVTVFVDVFGMGIGRGRDIMVTIPQGANLDEISEVLDAEGVISHPFLFKIVVKASSGDYLFQQGGHLIGKSLSYKSIAEELTKSPDVNFDETVSVLIPEGYEAWQIAETLEEKGLVDKDRFLRELDEGDFDFDFIKDIKRTENRLEGYLFPATYEFATWETEHDIIVKMLKAFEAYILPVFNQAETDYTLDEVVTFASMVEREAANDSERGKVASVFHNRLKRDMTLSSCATVQYIIKERKAILSNSDIKIKSDYNTYINKGLPVGPIASPGVRSVEATLNPDDTDYLYFAARADGSENVFSRTGEEHLKTVEILQR